MRWKCVGRVNTLFPPPPSLSSASSMCPPILRATLHTNRSKEGERACKHSWHALSPACRVAPTCARPRHMCGGPCSLPLPRAGFAPRLCAQTGCVGRHPKGTHPSPLFATRPHSSDKTMSAGLAAAPPSHPRFTSGGIACTSTGHGKPARGTTPAPCVPLTHASRAHERGWGWGMPPSPTPVCARRAQGWAATRAGAVPPLLPPCPRE